MGSEQEVEVEMGEVSDKINVSPEPLQFSCNRRCSFHKQEYDLDTEERSKSSLKLGVLIIFYVMVMSVEVAGGLKSNSLAVLTDAAHLLADVAGFSISLFTIWASSWAATSKQSFGFNRIEVLGALCSLQLIWLISGILIYEAVDRMLHKNTKVDGKVMFAVAAFGFIVNFTMVVWLGHGHSHHDCIAGPHNHGKEHQCAKDEEEGTKLVSNSPDMVKSLNLNVQGAYMHVMADMIQSVGVMVAGSIIWFKPNWLLVDLLCTLIFSVVALATTIPMLSNLLCILMENTPGDIDICSVENDIRSIKGVSNVHDLHVWAITNGKLALACHVAVEQGDNSNEILHKIRDCCEGTYSIRHVTIQVEVE